MSDSFVVAPPDPNDGRFDDIDDDDPMEGIEIPKQFLPTQDGANEHGATNPHQGASGQIAATTDKSALSDISAKKSENLGNFSSKNQENRSKGREPGGQRSNHGVWNIFDRVFGGKISTESEDDPQSSNFQSLLSTRPTISNPTVDSESSQSTKGSFESIFGPKKSFQMPPREKFIQPTKVDKIKPDPWSSVPMEFLMRLRHGNGRLGRGYYRTVEPLSHKTPKPENHTRFVCVSDTHNEHGEITLPEGDVLLHCGDFTLAGRLYEVDDFNKWLGDAPYEHKIVIAGNHELSFDPKIMETVKIAKERNSYVRFGKYLKPIEEREWMDIRSRLTNCTYLEDSEVTINGIRIWGSPWQPEFGGWGFNVRRGMDILKKWDKIPDGVDILMTHGPPVGHGDKVMGGERVGCVDLLNTVQLRVQPKYHLFGHIHEDYGITTDQFTTYVNCSTVNYHYVPDHKVIIFDLPNKDAAE